MSHSTEAYLSQAGESEVRWMGPSFTSFLATGARTGGIFGLVEDQSIQGESVPLHRHDDDWEAFYILDGEMSFYIEDQLGRIARAGAFVYIPQGTIHGFRIASKVARSLILTTPRHAEFYRAITLPQPHAVITDAMIEQACQEYGIEFISPLPDE